MIEVHHPLSPPELQTSCQEATEGKMGLELEGGATRLWETHLLVKLSHGKEDKTVMCTVNAIYGYDTHWFCDWNVCDWFSGTSRLVLILRILGGCNMKRELKRVPFVNGKKLQTLLWMWPSTLQMNKLHESIVSFTHLFWNGTKVYGISASRPQPWKRKWHEISTIELYKYDMTYKRYKQKQKKSTLRPPSRDNEGCFWNVQKKCEYSKHWFCR